MWSMFLITTQLLVQSCVCQNCVFTDPNTGAVLYLDALQDASLVFTSNTSWDDHTYTYTPCRNAAECFTNGQFWYSMCGQIGNDCSIFTIIALWDSSVQPTYDPINGGQWSFQYQNGWGCNGNVPRLFTVNYLCDMEAGDYQIISAGESETVMCSYHYNINTKWACNGTRPLGECVWKSSDGEHILNISGMAGKSLSIADDEKENIYYVYSPCSNTMRCDDIYAMAYLLDGSTFDCKKYLAIWENGIIQPNYSYELKSWQFVYTNGESCNGFENVFIVEWICDETAETPKIIEAKETMTCNYQFRVNSTLACG
eukprot:83281_1